MTSSLAKTVSECSMPNIWTELEGLPRSSAVTIIGQLLRKHEPSMAEIARAMVVDECRVRRWIVKPPPQRRSPTQAAVRLGLGDLPCYDRSHLP